MSKNDVAPSSARLLSSLADGNFAAPGSSSSPSTAAPLPLPDPEPLPEPLAELAELAELAVEPDPLLLPLLSLPS